MVGEEVEITSRTQLRSLKFYITDYGHPHTKYSYGVLQTSNKENAFFLVKEYLINAGFEIEKEMEISQNTFPSKIVKARKVMKSKWRIPFLLISCFS